VEAVDEVEGEGDRDDGDDCGVVEPRSLSGVLENDGLDDVGCVLEGVECCLHCLDDVFHRSTEIGSSSPEKSRPSARRYTTSRSVSSLSIASRYGVMPFIDSRRAMSSTV
jgi:hypothetical protein